MSRATKRTRASGLPKTVPSGRVNCTGIGNSWSLRSTTDSKGFTTSSPLNMNGHADFIGKQLQFKRKPGRDTVAGLPQTMQ
ncbi:Uncharacterised protein [Bordetella pertussis]|nr:Uncharacterised protein [Bordetella pertussis]CFP69185.1 Uncharacterised protein [Bordetella pertussis]CFW42703.1 Uncharacterised protein [Bordetella pertussis]CPL23758.1 Uncharacterised protein [Bordetella pertussis]